MFSSDFASSQTLLSYPMAPGKSIGSTAFSSANGLRWKSILARAAEAWHESFDLIESHSKVGSEVDHCF
jgi:hypothetical protein